MIMFCNDYGFDVVKWWLAKVVKEESWTSFVIYIDNKT